MADDGKIYITISDKRFGQNKAEADEQNKIDKEKKTDGESAFDKYINHQVMHLARQQVTKFVHFSLGNIGNFTGDYVTQQRVNDLIASAQGFINIGTATIAGAKAGGWVGAIIGFVVGTVTEVASSAYSTYEKLINNKKTNYQIEQLRERAGLNALLDGSRGTEN